MICIIFYIPIDSYNQTIILHKRLTFIETDYTITETFEKKFTGVQFETFNNYYYYGQLYYGL